MDTVYNVKTEVFEGPLDLLLQLIEKRKLFINDVSLAAVTDDYIEEVNREGMLTLPHAAHFVYVASTLLLIKSKSLLPTLTLSEEEAGDIKDLELRLKLYQVFKQLAVVIRGEYLKQPMYERNVVLDVNPIFTPGKSLNIESLYRTMGEVLKQLPKLARLPEAVVDKVISLEEMIENLASRITKAVSMSFKDFAGGSKGVDRGSRLTVIVSFLALLELVKRGAIGVRQEEHFKDITIESEQVGTPRYN